LLPPGEKKDNKDDKEGLDWGGVYVKLICQTSMGYDEIGERTIPQIKAILKDMDMFISPGLLGFSGGSLEEPEPENEHSVDECMAAAAMFSGFG